MRLSLRFLALLFTACASAPPPAPPAPVTAPTAVAPLPAQAAPTAPIAPSVDEVKERVLARYNAEDPAGIFELFAPKMREAVPLERVQPIVAKFIAEKGHVTSSKLLSSTECGRHAQYALVAERGTWELDLFVDDAGKISGLMFQDTAGPPVASNDVPIALPFRGHWSVVWGGDRAELNHHVGVRSQRRAADLLMTRENGKTYRTDGKKNEDYLAYGQEVIAVADGVVETVVDGVPENAPHVMSTSFVPGNLVILRHTPKLYSVYAHLQPGSARLKVGAKIKQGELVGRCGNTGHSTEPHLHFQLQDSASFDSSWGVEAHFKDIDIVRAGKPEKVAGYTFLKGDVVEAPPAKTPLAKVPAPPIKP